MRKLILAFLISTSMSAVAQKANFSGNWLIDKSKTNFDHAAEWVVPKIIKVDQQAGKLILTRINIDNQQQEQTPVTETLAFDGTPFQRTPTAGNTVTTTLNWQNDQSFILVRNGTQTATETWTQENNGKTLVVNRVVALADGRQYTIKCYYSKQ